MNTRPRPPRPAPILEFPGDTPAVIDPGVLYAHARRVPARVVLSFFHDVLERRAAEGRLVRLRDLTGEGPPIPVYALADADPPTTVCWAGLTAPFSTAILEELIGLGGRAFIVCGGAGALDGSIPVGHLVLPTAALRAEGTSYHYQRRGRYSRPHPAAVQALRETLAARGLPFVEGATWTTDGVFRETRPMIRRRRAEGCLTVEMEAAALFAVARYRGVVLGQVLYAGDDVSGPEWDERGWRTRRDVREGLLDVALAACGRLPLPG